MSFPPATIELNPRMNQLLELLASRLETRDKGDVLKRALSLYSYLVEQSSTSDIFIRNRYSQEERRLDLGIRGYPETTQTDQGATPS